MCGVLCPSNAGSSPSRAMTVMWPKAPSGRTGPEKREKKPIAADPREPERSSIICFKMRATHRWIGGISLFFSTPPPFYCTHLGRMVVLLSSSCFFSLFSSESSLQLKKGATCPAFQLTEMKKQTIICACVVLLCYAMLRSRLMHASTSTPTCGLFIGLSSSAQTSQPDSETSSTSPPRRHRCKLVLSLYFFLLVRPLVYFISR
jgi:hypothetical protein